MALEALVQEIENMPESSQQEVLRFVRLIKREGRMQVASMAAGASTKRQGGWLKGKVVMASDFDVQADDFKGYA